MRRPTGYLFRESSPCMNTCYLFVYEYIYGKYYGNRKIIVHAHAVSTYQAFPRAYRRPWGEVTMKGANYFTLKLGINSDENIERPAR